MTDVARRTRFQLIQALRGVAALWVVLFHIDKGRYIAGLTDRLPVEVQWALFGYGSAGVAIFFVLSGFVISHSLTDKAFGGSDFLRFVARRSVRLDPPYWAAIVLSIMVTSAIGFVNHDPNEPPSIQTLIAHVFYLQVLIGAPEINIVFWTLAYEVQFYLLLALATWLRTWLIRRIKSDKVIRAIVTTPLAALALLAAGNMLDWAPYGLFVTLWHGFFLGVLAYEAGYLKQSPVLLLLLVAVTLVGAVEKESVFGAPAAFTAVGLFVAGRTGHLVHGLNARGLQMLGTISYSLYLIHIPVMHAGFALWGRIAGRGAVQDSLGLIIVLSGTLGAATIFWWLFERPSHRVAAKLFRRHNASPVLT